MPQNGLSIVAQQESFCEFVDKGDPKFHDFVDVLPVESPLLPWVETGTWPFAHPRRLTAR